MIHHVTHRLEYAAKSSRCYAMDKNAVVKFFSQGLVCVSDLRMYAFVL